MRGKYMEADSRQPTRKPYPARKALPRRDAPPSESVTEEEAESAEVFTATQPPPIPISERIQPWVQLKYFSFHPAIFKTMVAAVSPQAKAGDWVQIYDRNGQPFGRGLYNPSAKVPLRVFYHGQEQPTDKLLATHLERAAHLRKETLGLFSADETDACRVVHSDGDNLSGLVVDRYADTLSIEVHSLGIWQRLPAFTEYLHRQLGTKRQVVHVDSAIAKMEGIRVPEILQRSDNVNLVKIKEHGIRYEVNFSEGHKTGFFCDQRENRRKLGEYVKQLGAARVLDLCCYSGGFSLSAKLLGGAEEVTAVDLDEKAIAQAKRNMNLNQTRLNLVHTDAFAYARQMQRNGTTWPVVVLDPPKLVLSRREEMDGRKTYEDLNWVTLRLVESGGLFVTCSCSGLLPAEDFEQIVIRAAHRQNRRLQILERTGPGADHPVLSNCPESRYLKVIWARVF